ncbi:MAG: hydroxyisourate hydrolase [Pseudomonadota bacterium]
MSETETGWLSTHVLDTANGHPAGGMKIDLVRLGEGGETALKSAVTNDDGRTDSPMLDGEAFQTGHYELRFHVGDYVKSTDQVPFLDVVPVRFGITDAKAHYHVPLLVSPYGYSTYRGS